MYSVAVKNTNPAEAFSNMPAGMTRSPSGPRKTQIIRPAPPRAVLTKIPIEKDSKGNIDGLLGLVNIFSAIVELL